MPGRITLVWINVSSSKFTRYRTVIATRITHINSENYFTHPPNSFPPFPFLLVLILSSCTLLTCHPFSSFLLSCLSSFFPPSLFSSFFLCFNIFTKYGKENSRDFWMLTWLTIIIIFHTESLMYESISIGWLSYW